MDSDITRSKYSPHSAIFKDGCPEDYIKLLMSFYDIENLIPVKEAADKTSIFCTLLNGQVLSYFEQHLRGLFEAEDSEIPDNEKVLCEVGFKYWS
jgi:hypothetical protein